jgi:hypothetical protein
MKPNSILEKNPTTARTGLIMDGSEQVEEQDDEDQNEDGGRYLLTQKNWPTLFQ